MVTISSPTHTYTHTHFHMEKAIMVFEHKKHVIY